MARSQEPKRASVNIDKSSVKLTPYLGLLERPGGGCFAFNQTYFSPVKIEGEINKVHEFFKGIKGNGVKHLKSDLINLLLNNRILISKEDKAKPADKWSESKWEKAWKGEPFTIIFDEKIETKILLGKFKTLIKNFEHLFYPDRINNLTVKNTVFHSPMSIIRYKYNEIFKVLQISKFPFKFNWVIDASLDWFRMNMSEFSQVESPHVRFSTDIRNELRSEDLKALAALLNKGFCPHLTLWIYDLKAAKKTFSQLVKGLGKDNFTYEVKVEKKEIGAMPKNEIINFVQQCNEHKELLIRQAVIYMDILNKIQWHSINNLFADSESMGRTLIISSQKHIKPIYKLRENRRPDWIAELKKNLFGECSYSRKKCKNCSVQYFCGGVDKSCLNGSEEEQNCIAEINCAIRKGLILKFMKDATAKPKENHKIEFIPADGTIRIRKAG